jgi:hypothetical protein
MEFQYIESWKYFQDLIKTAEDLKREALESSQRQSEMIEKYEGKIKNIDSEYRKINDLIQTGDFKNINTLFMLGKAELKKFRDDLVNEKLSILHRLMLWIAAGIFFIIIMPFAGIGFLVCNKFIFKKISRKK